jgi:hypothetical protein
MLVCRIHTNIALVTNNIHTRNNIIRVREALALAISLGKDCAVCGRGCSLVVVRPLHAQQRCAVSVWDFVRCVACSRRDSGLGSLHLVGASSEWLRMSIIHRVASRMHTYCVGHFCRPLMCGECRDVSSSHWEVSSGGILVLRMPLLPGCSVW